MTSSSLAEPRQNICSTFSRSCTLQQCKLYANIEKCSFGMQRIQYLGCIVDEHGVHVDPTKIQLIERECPSLNLIEIFTFLGPAKFYQRFMLGFSHIAWPLSQVTKGGPKVKFYWSRLQYKAFEDVKHHLSSTPLLPLQHFQEPFEIEMYIFDYVICVVFIQQRHLVDYKVEQSLIIFGDTSPMIRRCTPSYRHVDSGSIIFGGKETIIHIDHKPVQFV